MRTTARRNMKVTMVVATAAATVGLLAACGTSGSSDTGTPTTSAVTNATAAGSSVPVAENSIASTMIFGGPPECPERPPCLPGLESTYGLKFKEFKSLDAGGPLTVAALKNDDIQIGLLFTSDGQISANDWVLLEDDKDLQPIDQVTPVANEEISKAYGDDFAKVVDGVSAKLTTKDLVEMNKAASIDEKDPDQVAKDWVKEKGLAPATTPAAKTGPTIKVGSANFTENVVLANVYAQVLEANGYPVETKLKVGSREVYYPALKAGTDINFIPEYDGSLLTVTYKGTATSDAKETHDALVKAATPDGVTVYASSSAEDKNGFVVTKATADKYKLTKLSDLAKPAS